MNSEPQALSLNVLDDEACNHSMHCTIRDTIPQQEIQVSLSFSTKKKIQVA